MGEGHAREEGLALLLVVGLVGVEHAVEPGEELLGAVVRVENDGDAVRRRDGADVVGRSDGAGDGRLLVAVLDALAGEEGGTALRDLDDDGRLGVTGALERGDDGRRRGAVLRARAFESALARARQGRCEESERTKACNERDPG